MLRWTACALILVCLSLGCGSDDSTKPPAGDTNPPAAIGTLASVGPAGRVVTLVWSAPGDDGTNGRASRYDLRYAATTLTEGSWTAATPVTTVPVPGAAGIQEQVELSDLPLGTWYFAVKAADEVPNWSGLSNVIPVTVVDPTPPAAVTDLAAMVQDSSSVTLAWTAPGSDGTTGTAAAYDLRYASATITEGTWSAATPVGGVPSPAIAGTRESLSVTGLEPRHDYYFALKTRDEASNWSGLSNVAIGRTEDLGPPAVIEDLTAPAADAQGVTLGWTAPGGDGDVGQAHEYDIRYALALITEDTWGLATRVSPAPTPGPAGTAETCTVTGLSAGTLYYFAIRSRDQAGNWSGISTSLGMIPGRYPMRRLTYSSSTFIGALNPAWSPDGKDIAFRANWAEQFNSEIYRIPADGGLPMRLTRNEGDDLCPSWSPDGTRILHVSDQLGDNPVELWTMLATDGGSRTRVTRQADRFILKSAWSPDGSRIAFEGYRISSGSPSFYSEIYLITPTGGGLQRLTGLEYLSFGPTWSPDGTRIAFGSNRSGDNNIWVVSTASGEQTPLTSGPGGDSEPAWSPEGGRIAFSSNRSGQPELWLMSASGGDLVQLTNDSPMDYGACWSPDGRRLAFVSRGRADATVTDIWILYLE